MYLPALPLGVTSVTGVRLYATEERDTEPVSAPVALVGGRWHVDTLNVPPGRWWPRVDAMQGAAPYSYPLHDPVDLPEDDRLVVSPEALAEEIDLPLPLTPSQRKTLRRAILAAQSDVLAYLGQPITPEVQTETGVWAIGEEWSLSTSADNVQIISATPELDVDGQPLHTFTITYLAGIDAKHGEEYEPIRRFLLAHASNSPQVVTLWREVVKPKGTIKSSSTEGQSVSYTEPTLGGGGAAGSGNPGALPTLGSLDRWRVAKRRVVQGHTQFGRRY